MALRPPIQKLLLFFCCCSFSAISEAQPLQEPCYARFSFDASRFPWEDEYDYVVVGGGTAGCPLAATLSETHRVLLLERGGSPLEFPDVLTREGFLRTLLDAGAHDSPAQPFTSEEGVANARGRVLGGSSTINAGFYSRAEPGFFHGGGLGPVTWNMGMVNESYDWVERSTTFRPTIQAWQLAVRDGLLEANVTPYNGFTVDHVQGTKIGATTFDGYGVRHGAADLLNYANADNIRVALRASVKRILLNPVTEGRNQEAIGVVYRDRFGQQHRAMTAQGGEVILCAGALGSPQLLLLSGIGPRRYLSSMGIPLAYHHPHVGQFMYDNPRNGISITTSAPLDHSLIQVVGITGEGTFIEAASNVIPFFVPNSTAPLYTTVATLIAKVAGPMSFGRLRLASLDVRDNPVVRFNYFSDPRDLARCVAGVRKVAKVMSGRAMEEFRFWNWLGGAEFQYVGTAPPANRSDDAVVEDFCRSTVATLWHYHGGCVAGKVVDGDFKVTGIGSLRVVDGSTLSVSPGTNPQATLLMLGRYVGQKMQQERTASPRWPRK